MQGNLIKISKQLTVRQVSQYRSSPAKRRISFVTTINLEAMVPSDVRFQQERLLRAGNDDSDDNGNRIHLSQFQRKVYTALCYVPEGYVTTYQHIAKFIQCYSNQAIGQALKRNPYCPIIPCHRVIKSDGTIGGFHGQTSGEYIKKKIKMLHDEGVSFTDEGKVKPQCIYDFSDIHKANDGKVPDASIVSRKRRKTALID